MGHRSETSALRNEIFCQELDDYFLFAIFQEKFE